MNDLRVVYEIQSRLSSQPESMSEPISVPTTKPPSEQQQPSNEPREKSQTIPHSNRRGTHSSPELAMILNDAISLRFVEPHTQEPSMKCAQHPDVDATGYCRQCGKPLCPECTRDVRGALYCENCLANIVSSPSSIAWQNGCSRRAPRDRSRARIHSRAWRGLQRRVCEGADSRGGLRGDYRGAIVRSTRRARRVPRNRAGLLLFLHADRGLSARRRRVSWDNRSRRISCRMKAGSRLAQLF